MFFSDNPMRYFNKKGSALYCITVNSFEQKYEKSAASNDFLISYLDGVRSIKRA